MGKGQQAAQRMQEKTDALVRTGVHYITQSSCAHPTHMPAIIQYAGTRGRAEGRMKDGGSNSQQGPWKRRLGQRWQHGERSFLWL